MASPWCEMVEVEVSKRIMGGSYECGRDGISWGNDYALTIISPRA